MAHLSGCRPFLESRYYGGIHGTSIFFTLKRGESGTLNAVLESGYGPGLVYCDDFLAAHKNFLYLDIPWAHAPFLERWKALHQAWRIRQVGELPYQTRPAPLLQIEQ